MQKILKSKLSKELLLAVYVNQRNKANLPCTFTQAVSDLSKSMSKQTLSIAQDILDDMCALNYEWIQRNDSKWCKHMILNKNYVEYFNKVEECIIED